MIDQSTERFQLIERIGAGGMATVWRSHDRTLGRDVAIKKLHAHVASEAKAVERFRREASTVASLNHPAIVTVYDAGLDDEGLYLVMEYVDGHSLSDRLRRERRLATPEAAAVAGSVAEALAYAHSRGVVHCDVKPGNILIDGEGRTRLADFGIARAVGDTDRLTTTGSMRGTVTYMSPERVAGDEASPASDVYSLGVVLYEMLTGSPPFVAEGAVAVALAHRDRRPERVEARADVDSRLGDLVMRSLAKDPELRPTAADMAELLSSFASEPEETHLQEPSTPRAATRALTVPVSRPGMDAASSDAPTVLMPPRSGDTLVAPKQRMSLLPWLIGIVGVVIVLAVVTVGYVIASSIGQVDGVSADQTLEPATLPEPTAAESTAAPSTTMEVAAPPVTAGTAVEPIAADFVGAIGGVQALIAQQVGNGSMSADLGAQIDGKVAQAREKWEQNKLKEADQALQEIEQKLQEGRGRNEVTAEAALEVQAALAQTISIIANA